MRCRCMWPALLALITSIPALNALSQSGPTASQPDAALASIFTSESGLRTIGIPIETLRRDHPLSAEITTTHIQKLPDGTTRTKITRTRLTRDNDGRVRLDAYYDNGQPMLAYLLDPVARTVTYLQTAPHTASLFSLEGSQMMKELAERIAWTPTDAGRLGETVQPLPARTIDGVRAEGTQFTRIIPAVSTGNNEPVTIVTKSWFSPQLGLELERTVDDSRSGETTASVTEVQTMQPDVALFQIPSDYKQINH